MTHSSGDTVSSLAALATEGRNPHALDLDRLDAAGIAQLMNAQDATIAPLVAEQIPAIAKLIDAVVARLRRGGRLIFTGAGTSGRLGVLDAAECVPTFQSPPGQIAGLIAGGMGAMFRAVEGAEDSRELAAKDLRALGLDARDCVVGIAASGRTPYVLGSLEEARSQGALTGAIACVKNSRIGALADHGIEVETGPEVLMGSTRLRAGTATKLVLNTLTTAAMILLGKTWGDLMVDLRASNEKLRLRSARLVALGAGVDAEAATRALQEAHGEVKTAIVCLKKGISVAEARARLLAASGRVAIALKEGSPTVSNRLGQKARVGIDGGGTALKVQIAVADNDKVQPLAIVSGPPVLPATHGFDGVAFEWRRRILGELEKAGLGPEAVASIVAGTSGAGTPEARRQLTEQMKAWFPGATVRVLSDVQLLALAAGDKQALCLVAGTGSIAWWEPTEGVTHRAGGYGPGVGDEGSGLWLAEEGVRAVCMAEDGRGPETTLTQALLQTTNTTNARELATWWQGAGRTAARLAAEVLRQAATGDLVATSLRTKAIYHLRALVQAVTRKEATTKPQTLVATGGLFQNEDFWQSFTEAFTTSGKELPVWKRVADPVSGALQAALKTEPESEKP